MKIVKYLNKEYKRRIKAPGTFFSKGIMGFFLFLLMLSFNSCSDRDVPLINEDDDVPEGMVGLSILIPDYEGNSAQFGTRAFNEEDEGNMSNLYVIAVKYAEYNYNEGSDTYVETVLDAKDRTVYTFSINPEGVIFNVGDQSYKRFNIALYPGKYRFGVLANVDRYIERKNHISEFTQESELDNITLNFYEDIPLIPLHLPMACLPNEIKYKVTTKDKDGKEISTDEGIKDPKGYVSIEKGKTTTIQATMKFLCAKVRYTILFDKSDNGISKAFGSSWIRFNVDDDKKPFATKLRKQTLLFPEAKGNNYDSKNTLMPEGYTSDKGPRMTPTDGVGYATRDGEEVQAGDEDMYAWWNMSINRFKWHETEGANYPMTPHTSVLEPWDDTLDKWIESKRKVWQGIVYLPENLDEDKGKRTILEFPYHTRANSEDDTPEVLAPENKKIILFGDGETQYGLIEENKPTNDEKYKYGDSKLEGNDRAIGLQRNYMYDVVARVMNPDIDDMDIKVFVSVIHWHEIDQNIQDDGGDTASEISLNVGNRKWKTEDYSVNW